MAESWITNRPVGAALTDWFRGPPRTVTPVEAPRLTEVMSQDPSYPAPNVPVSAHVQSWLRGRLPADIMRGSTASDEASRPRLGYLAPITDYFSLPASFTDPPRAPARQAPAAPAREIAAGEKAVQPRMPITYGGAPVGEMTINQAMKFLSVAKPPTPREEAQRRLLGFAENQLVGLDATIAQMKLAKRPQTEINAQIAEGQKNFQTLMQMLSGANHAYSYLDR